MKTLRIVIVLGLLIVATTPVMAAINFARPDDGGGGEIPDTGELYGDLFVILRDEDGVPILNENECLQPISAVNDEVVIATANGPLTVTVEVGEPFALPSYTDTAGDEVECELTEDMADWVQEVDFGRLNLGRSPQAVIDHAFDEAITKMNAATSIGIDPSGRIVVELYDEELEVFVFKTIDAPAENLALYIKMMTDGHWMLPEDTTSQKGGGPPDGKGKKPGDDGAPVEERPMLSDEAISLLENLLYGGLGEGDRTTADLTSDELQLAASLLAAAADKTGRITLDKVVYINSIYGINQVGALPGNAEGEMFFDFGNFYYGRRSLYEGRSSVGCGDGYIKVLQPLTDAPTFGPDCVEILGYYSDTEIDLDAVHFFDMVEAYTTVEIDYDFVDNVRAFAQAADDALQVLEYLHNYKVPVDLYGTWFTE